MADRAGEWEPEARSGPVSGSPRPLGQGTARVGRPGPDGQSDDGVSRRARGQPDRARVPDRRSQLHRLVRRDLGYPGDGIAVDGSRGASSTRRSWGRSTSPVILESSRPAGDSSPNHPSRQRRPCRLGFRRGCLPDPEATRRRTTRWRWVYAIVGTRSLLMGWFAPPPGPTTAGGESGRRAAGLLKIAKAVLCLHDRIVPSAWVEDRPTAAQSGPRNRRRGTASRGSRSIEPRRQVSPPDPRGGRESGEHLVGADPGPGKGPPTDGPARRHIVRVEVGLKEFVDPSPSVPPDTSGRRDGFDHAPG